MVKLFLDTEFNGKGGDLISIALVARKGLQRTEFYEVDASFAFGYANDWVRENVIPFLGKHSIRRDELRDGLLSFLGKFNEPLEIYADWPDDFIYFCELLSDRGALDNYTLPLECTMHLIRSGPTNPRTPHNALSDAHALCDWYFQNSTPDVAPGT